MKVAVLITEFCALFSFAVKSNTKIFYFRIKKFSFYLQGLTSLQFSDGNTISKSPK